MKRLRLNNPIGKTIQLLGKEVEIIGITEDFFYQSLHNKIEPCIFKLFWEEDNVGNYIWIKLKAGQETKALAEIKRLYQEFNPGYSFEYKFVDEEYQALYESETRVAVLSKYFAGLAILISCLGIFGLAAFTAERRIKEIGIRKILGSSVWEIVKLLSTDFTKMVLVAIIIALPTGFIIVRKWLEGFAYKIDLVWWYFVGAAIIALLIAWVTVSIQTLKAAQINPAQCLRDE